MSDDQNPGRATIFLGHETAARILGLPAGMRIVGVDHDSRKLGVLFGVEADWLAELLEGADGDVVRCDGFDVETMVDDEGRAWHRWRPVADGAILAAPEVARADD